MSPKNGFTVFGLTAFVICAFGCGGCPVPESKPDRFSYPSDRSIQHVKGRMLVGHGVFSEDQDNISKFIKFAALNSQDAVSGMVRRGEVEQIENGSRVKIRYSDQFESMVKVDVLDGIHAGKTGWMHVLECGGNLNKIKTKTTEATKSATSKRGSDSVPSQKMSGALNRKGE